MKQLIVLTGVPGSGKTTYSQKFKQKGFIISTDEIRKQIFGTYDCLENEKLVWETFYNRVEWAVKNKDLIILDAVFSKEYHRLKLYQLYKKYVDKFSVIQFKIPLNILKIQNNNREKKISETDLIKHYNTYENLTDKELQLYDEVIIIEKETHID